MRTLKIIALLFLVLLGAGCASVGPTVMIETPKPAEDFVVLCEWYKVPLLKMEGGGVLSKRNVYVTSSGKNVDCGVALTGGDTLVKVMHPTYTDAKVSKKDGVNVYKYTKTKLDVLDELKAKFESGFWDKYKHPGAEYARHLVGCSFPYQYFDYYSKVKKVHKNHFKKLYNDEILQCMRRTFPIMKKYLRGYEHYPDADEYMVGL